MVWGTCGIGPPVLLCQGQRHAEGRSLPLLSGSAGNRSQGLVGVACVTSSFPEEEQEVSLAWEGSAKGTVDL